MINCHECGSEKLIDNARVFDRGDGDSKKDFQVYIDEEPNALFFKERTYHSLGAVICGDCGFVHFVANRPKSLWDAYQRQRKKI